MSMTWPMRSGGDGTVSGESKFSWCLVIWAVLHDRPLAWVLTLPTERAASFLTYAERLQLPESSPANMTLLLARDFMPFRKKVGRPRMTRLHHAIDPRVLESWQAQIPPSDDWQAPTPASLRPRSASTAWVCRPASPATFRRIIRHCALYGFGIGHAQRHQERGAEHSCHHHAGAHHERQTLDQHGFSHGHLRRSPSPGPFSAGGFCVPTLTSTSALCGSTARSLRGAAARGFLRRSSISMSSTSRLVMMPLAADPNTRHCGACSRDVHLVRTEAEFKPQADAGQCVAVRLSRNSTEPASGVTHIVGSLASWPNSRWEAGLDSFD